MPESQMKAPAEGATARVRLSPEVKAFVSLAAAHTMVDGFSNIWPIFKKLAGLDLAWAGLIAAVVNVLTSALQPIFGLWSDHGYRRHLVLIGSALVCLMVLLGPISRYPGFMHHPSGYATMFTLLLVAKFGLSMFHPPAVSLAGSTSLDRKSMLVSLFIAFGMVGMGSSHLMFSKVYLSLDRRTEILLIPGIAIVLWVALWCRVPQRRIPGPLGLRTMLGKLAGLPGRLIVLWVIQVLTSTVFMSTFFLMPEFMEERGLSQQWVNGGALAVWMTGSVAMMVVVGHIADRLGRRRVLFVCLLVGAAAFYAATQAPRLSAPVLLALMFLTGGMIGSANPVVVSLGQHLAPAYQSLITGVLMGFAWAAASPSLWVAGYLVKCGFSCGDTLALMGTGMVVAVLLVLFTPGLGGRSAAGGA